MARDIAIDLGASNLRIAERGRGIKLIEPSVLAVSPDDGRIIRAGSDADRLIGRSPGNVRALYPLADGIQASEGLTALLQNAVGKTAKHSLSHPDAVVCVSCASAAQDGRALEKTLLKCGIKRVYIVESPFAAAYGAGCDVYLPKSSMIVDIGAASTDIGVISLGGIAASDSLRVAGFALDNAIASYIKKKHNIRITARTAEYIKCSVGTVWTRGNPEQVVFTGYSPNGGVSKELVMTSDETITVLEKPVSAIIDAVSAFIDTVPVEHLSDISSGGIILTGGSSRLWGFAELMEDVIGIKTRIAGDPENCVVNGAAKLLDNLADLPEGTVNISRPRDD